MNSRTYTARIEFLKPTSTTVKGGQKQYTFASARPPMKRMANVTEGVASQINLNDEQQTEYNLTVELPFDTEAAKVDNTWRIKYSTRTGAQTLNIGGHVVVESGRHPTIMIAARLDR